MPRTNNYAVYQPAAPYFDLIRSALGTLVDGRHFFDVVADDVVYEVLYDIPGWPRVITGRAGLMDAFAGYVEGISLKSADRAIVYHADGGHVVIVEYEVHGTIRASGMQYDNRFCSVIGLEDRKIARWRDYMDSLAAWTALTSEGG